MVKRSFFVCTYTLINHSIVNRSHFDYYQKISRKLEAVNPIKEPLKSDLLNGKWELIYTTSRSILQTEVAAYFIMTCFITTISTPTYMHSIVIYAVSLSLV